MARGRGGFIGQDGLNAPDAPTIGTASVASSTSLSIAFTAPTDVGGSAITEYLASARDSSGNVIGASGASSPITVTSLTLGTTYTTTVIARNPYGSSVPSAASNSATPVAQGQQAYTSAGSYSWTAPSGVTSVSVVAVGGGGRSNSGAGGGGGELRYKNNISVTAGSSYTVVVGDPGSATSGGSYAPSSTFNSTTVVANGGQSATSGSQAGVGGSGGTGDGGGNGGSGGNASSNYGSGGGAGGYSGAGGNGSGNNTSAAGSGGGGGGGHNSGPNYLYAGGGGGVGLLGQGTNGAANGGGGSGGSNGTFTDPNGGIYGGGGGAANGSSLIGAYGAVGAVRIIWPGATRQFPSTNTGDV